MVVLLQWLLKIATFYSIIWHILNFNIKCGGFNYHLLMLENCHILHVKCGSLNWHFNKLKPRHFSQVEFPLSYFPNIPLIFPSFISTQVSQRFIPHFYRLTYRILKLTFHPSLVQLDAPVNLVGISRIPSSSRLVSLRKKLIYGFYLKALWCFWSDKA